MVTGRSPKVIRLHELPQQLQPIIAKALEEEKDTRYQSAKEFLEALKGSSGGTRKWTGPAQFGCALQEGQCKACGTVTSDLTRKFCRNPQCGAGLRVACLKCDAQIAVWDGVCGECGGNQPALLAAKRESLAAARAEAEALLAGFAFDEAIALARPLADEAHVDLAEFAAWGGEFLASATAERERQRALCEERLHAARLHLGAWDYPAAIQAIESIPASLRDAETEELLEQCGERRRASDELIATIATRISRKEIDGLLPVVEQAIALRGDRQDMVKIRGQLVEWHERKQAKTLSQPRFSNSIGIELKLLPSGTFTMGQAGGDSDETPHQATLSRSFHIGVYPVTNSQWKRVMGTVPSRWTDNDRPVEGVSWDDAAEFCRRVSALPEERQVGRVYRLPTEAEWEYACRAGSTARFSFGDDESRLGEYGWYADKSGGTHPVGQKKPNAWGLYDMHGNVWEWCSDWYGNYADIATIDPHVTEAPRIERPINEFVFPDLGEDVASAKVIKVFVSSGDWVEQGQKCLEVETEKAVVEIPAEASGRIKDLLVAEGHIVKAGQVLALLEHGRTVARPGRVVRGGGWPILASLCRSASRLFMFPTYRGAVVGFRVAMSQPKVTPPKAARAE